MNNIKPILKFLNMLIILLTLTVTICGICSFNTTQYYNVVNQYGEDIQMWGAGIYSHDSYFKAPIFIGTDFTILIVAVPLICLTFLKANKTRDVEYYIQNFSVLSLLFYYATSLAFGVTYNNLHLVYIALFSVCFFSISLILAKLHMISIYQKGICSYRLTKGMEVFLLIAGISLFVAWLPDIITSITKGTSLELIEVYTTEITYVLDMGIISPLIFLTYYLVRKKNFIGYVLLRMIFKVFIGVGVMLPIQSAFQLLAGISIPIPALITKVLIFVILATFATIFEYQLKQGTEYMEYII